jgi:hypothetical protein
LLCPVALQRKGPTKLIGKEPTGYLKFNYWFKIINKTRKFYFSERNRIFFVLNKLKI